MSVAVQKMVRPRAAGVAFTLDPHSGDRSQIAIDASWGFGEAVVAGEVTPDNYLVDKVLFEITRRTVSRKADRVPAGRHGRGWNRPRCRRTGATAPCLDDEEIKAVARLARTSEKHYGRPQDVEWALDADLPAGERVLLLQSRPETVWSSARRRRSARAPRPATTASCPPCMAHCTARPAIPPGNTGRQRSLTVARAMRNDASGEEAWQTVPRPIRDRDTARRRGVGGALHLLALFSEDRRDYEASMFWFQDGVHWPDRADAVGRDVLRARHRHAVAVQHPALHDPAGARDRHPDRQRLQLPHPRPGRRPGRDRAPGAVVPGARRVLLRQLGPALRQLADQDARAWSPRSSR